jgi:MSHA biogenesis protein MshL
VKKSGIILLVSFFLLSSCAVNPPKNSNTEDQIDKALQSSVHTNKSIDKQQQWQLPKYVDRELTPDYPAKIPGVGKGPEHRFNIAVKDVPAHDFFMGLVKDTKQSMMVDPKVTGKISLTLKNVTVPQVLDAVRDAYGYEHQETSYGYAVFPRQMQTKIFSVDYLNLTRQGKSYTNISAGEISRKVTPTNAHTTKETDTKPTTQIDTSTDVDFWKILKESLQIVVGKEAGSSVVINPQAGLVVVHAYPNTLRNVAHYLDEIQSIMQRQVIMDAKIIEVVLNAQFQSGIEWNILGLKQQGFQNITTGLGTSVNQFTDIFKLDINSGDEFNAIIHLLNTQGKVNVLSSPRVSALNNQEAVIKVGENEFFVTNVDSEVAATTYADNNIVSQDIDFTPFFSGIALDVIPQIDEDGMVTLHIHPIVSKVSEDKKAFVVNGKVQEYPLARSDIRESDTVVRAKSGQVIVIGGLMETENRTSSAGTPGAEDLPNAGGLFKDQNKLAQKIELIILLRPVVIGQGTWTKVLRQAAYENKDFQGDFAYHAKFDFKK